MAEVSAWWPMCRLALGPLLLAQGAAARRRALRLPEPQGPRAGEVMGGHSQATLRLLFVGDSSMAGVGAEHQHQALAHQTALAVAAQQGCAVRWQLVARSGITTAQALTLLDELPPAPADAVVLALGVNDVTAQRDAQRFIADYEALLGTVVSLTGARCAVVSGLPPLHRFPALPQPLRWYLGQCGLRLDHALREWCEADASRHYLPLEMDAAEGMARDGFHPGPAQYRQWAQRVAEVLSGDEGFRLRDGRTV